MTSETVSEMALISVLDACVYTKKTESKSNVTTDPFVFSTEWGSATTLTKAAP